MFRIVLCHVFAASLGWCSILSGAEVVLQERGREIYAEHCASCHGDRGEGVDDEYDEALWGNKSLESLTRYIHKSMPEDEEELVIDEDAAAVARYVYDAFYSPAAQARIRPPRIELLRLKNELYRQSIADLVGSFGRRVPSTDERGLRARYSSSNPGKKGDRGERRRRFNRDRIDPTVDFNFGTKAPLEGMSPESFSIDWEGSLLIPESGDYHFRIRTQNGAMLHLNSYGRDKNHEAFIDAYVSTGNVMQEKTAKTHLLGGRAYPLKLLYFSFKEKHGSIHLEWKRPHGVWEAIPAEFLMPRRVEPVMVVQSRFSADDRSLGYERGSDISREWQQLTTYAAIDVVNHLIENLEPIAGIAREEFSDGEKMREFVTKFAERAFRRPLDSGQREFFIDQRISENGISVEALKEALLLVLTSPRFLYPGLSDGEGEPDGHAVAARLALLLWDSLPDAALRDLASGGKLRHESTQRAQIQRMIEDPRARRKFRSFFQHWLAMDEREDLGKDKELYPGFDHAIIADLRRSLEDFVEMVVWSEKSDYRQLLLADYLLLNPRLAGFYEAPSESSEAFVRTKLPDGQRAGIFTHPYLLSANAYHDNTSPIHRGVFLSRNVMGRLLKPPPEAVAFKNDEFDPSLTMREKVTELTKEEDCMQCHRVINPVGFSLENFDAVGRYRSVDNHKPVNTVSDYVNDRDEKVRVESATDLAELAVDSPAAHRAFITHLFHHLAKQPAAAYGEDTLEDLREDFVKSGYSIRKLSAEISVLVARHGLKSDAARTGKTPES